MKKQKRPYKRPGPDGIRERIRKPSDGFLVLFASIRKQAIDDEKIGVKTYSRGEWRTMPDSSAWSVFSATFSHNKMARVAIETIFGEQVFSRDYV